MRPSNSPDRPMSRRRALEAGVLIAGTAWVAPVIQPIALTEAAAETTSIAPSIRGQSGEANASPDFAGAQLSRSPEGNTRGGSAGSQNEPVPRTDNGGLAGTPGADQSDVPPTRAGDGSQGPDGLSVWGTPGADAR